MSASRFPCITANFTLNAKRVKGKSTKVAEGEDICRSGELAFILKDVKQGQCDYENTPFIRTALAEGDDSKSFKAVGFVMPVYGNCNEKIAVQMTGIVTVINNSAKDIAAGSKIMWSNPGEYDGVKDWELSNGRARRHPSDRNRHVAVLHNCKNPMNHQDRLVGMALTSAKRGQPYSLHVQLGG
jgi:hypothetical protein